VLFSSRYLFPTNERTDLQ